MNQDKNTKKETTSAPDALPQVPQTSDAKPDRSSETSYCHNCRKNTESELSVPYCDRNPLGLSSITPERHGNIIDGMATCDDGYCNPQERALEEFYELAGADAVPQEIFARCKVCQHLKQPEPEEKEKPVRGSSPERKKRRSK